VVSTTVLLLPEFLPDLVEDDAVVLSFNDRQIVVRTPRPRTLLVSFLLRIIILPGASCEETGTSREARHEGAVFPRGGRARPARAALRSEGHWQRWASTTKC
jgi:hypothetical protein